MTSSSSVRGVAENGGLRTFDSSGSHRPRVNWKENKSETHQDGSAAEPKDSLRHSRPLTWEQARLKLRCVLEEYMNAHRPVARKHNSPKKAGIAATFFDWDLDLYLGALPASLALLILSCTSFSARKRGDTDTPLNVSADLRLYASQIVASVLLLLGVIISISFVRSRRYTCSRDTDMAKRRTISKFLSSTDQYQQDFRLQQDGDESSALPKPVESLDEKDTCSISGTAITDVYPVYRQGGDSEGVWAPVPTLLLVEGDFIALQVGDLAPARCRMMEVDSKGIVHSQEVVEGGEKVSVASSAGIRRSFSSAFPRGRTTLKSDSRELLTLCDRMRIFSLEETPLNRLLSIPEVKQRLPQIHGQLAVIRSALFCFAFVVSAITVAVIFVRPGISSTDLSIVLPAPFLAALGALPVTTPAFLFFLEVIGTAQILVTVHPHANARSEHGSYRSLFLRYAFALITSRLSLQSATRHCRACFHGMASLFVCDMDNLTKAASSLVHVPPASAFLLEKLGVATAFAIVDDELACEPHSTPQQLMIPSGKGMKLLDICETVEIDSDDDSGSDTLPGRQRGRSYGSSPHDSDSDSDDEHRGHGAAVPRGGKPKTKRHRKRKSSKAGNDDKAPSESDSGDEGEMEVQFEDPLWWQHLPSLKCIGLACLVADKLVDSYQSSEKEMQNPSSLTDAITPHTLSQHLPIAEKALARHICRERQRRQLHALGKCIGFSTHHNANGEKGDLSLFLETLRLRLFSTKLHGERLEMDAHALGLEESRSWGLLRPDCTSVVVRDRRSKAYQLLTVGDPRVVTRLCREAWQGENSTIFPLNASDRANILDTSTNWVLADLDVAAFSYSPLPHTLEAILTRRELGSREVYLVDNNAAASSSKESMSDEFALVNDQIFLGVLGSAVIPKKDIDKLLDIFNEAGVRFVYFSPRNMRRTKELASQMGIEVSWNCAISLRSLDEGQDDPHRMISPYADWDVNAKLPHGIENVRKHLEEVDNVPLLVSLFTDSTKETSKEMLRTFQDYSDTVLVMGLSHLARNFDIFAAADVAVGADVLSEELRTDDTTERQSHNSVLPHEISFVSAISAHPCAFSLRGTSAPSKMPAIIASGRAALEAAKAAGLFLIFGCVSFSLFVLFSMCAVSTSLPFVPTLGSVLYLQVVLPMIGMSMAASDAELESMERVPPKNVESITFERQEGRRLYTSLFVKALLPSVLPQILFLISFGELMIEFDPGLLASECTMSPEDIANADWTSIIRCEGLKEYSGDARTASGAIILAEMVLCVTIASASFVRSTIPILQEPPWRHNRLWAWACLASIGAVTIYLVAVLPNGTFAALPWYFFVLAVIMPCLCLIGHEMLKRSECRHAARAVKLRRLKFETRLGMWSPK